uniref:peptidylprolyl isomerase n=1 Tax=Poecilia formosa TaxID=48698 RepID=A0A087XF46_POEFO
MGVEIETITPGDGEDNTCFSSLFHSFGPYSSEGNPTFRVFPFICCFLFLGRTFPKKGQRVVVHYVGTLDDGKVFDSSRSRGKPFKFKIGHQEVIRGWEEGVAQMSVGQRAKLICSPDFAYGSKGHPGVIPPNATLTFDVELLGLEA